MESYIKLLQTYPGRDKMMRTACYVSMLVAGNVSGKAAKDFGMIAKQLSAARVMLRWFDDIPMLAYTSGYGIGNHEKDQVKRALTILGNVAGQLYFPVEHIAWLSDYEMLPFQGSNFWTAGVVLWGIGLVVNILKSLRNLMRIRIKSIKLVKQRKLESPDKSDSVDTVFRESMKDLQVQRSTEFLNLIKNGSDLLLAVNFLPKGYLWSQTFPLGRTGFFGTVSSIIGLYQLFVAQRPAKKE